MPPEQVDPNKRGSDLAKMSKSFLRELFNIDAINKAANDNPGTVMLFTFLLIGAGSIVVIAIMSSQPY